MTLKDSILASIPDFFNGEAEFIPLLSQEDEEQINSEKLPETLAILPLRNTVLFPGVVIPITVGRDKSIKLVKESYKDKKIIGVVAQKDAEIEDPGFSDLNQVGTVARIMKILQMPDGNTTVIIQGVKRFRLVEILQSEPYFIASVEHYGKNTKLKEDKEMKALVSSLKDLSVEIIRLSPNIPSEAAFAINNIESPVFLVNFISSNLNIDIVDKQKLLETLDFKESANKVLAALIKEQQLLELKNKIQNKVKIDIDKQQRDFFLNQQLKTIQEELGGNPVEQEIIDLKGRARNKKWSPAVEDAFDKELKKLQRLNPSYPEYSVHLNYLELMLELPWDDHTRDNFDLRRAKRVLDKDHYGLEKVKERIIEYLAVVKLKNDLKSPVLCLVGPPGVGKTSLGKSIATAIGRKYIRMSLGGVRDEAELRGHRKTYVGAMPGRIIQNIKKSKSSNPVFILDEIDKVSGMNINGDPQAALLEILDPEQNNSFHDNYLEIEYDLSKVMFISTANTLSTIHPALLDRMEVIDINGYLLEEKVQIAQRHLIPKQLHEHGMKPGQFVFSDDILETMIEQYTREAGVRKLEKVIASIIRNKAKVIVSNKKYNAEITLKDIHQVLGPPHFSLEKETTHLMPGVAVGLAWTAVGGETLFVEASLSKGKGTLTMTGNLGDVMKESATIAFEYLKANAEQFDLDPGIFQSMNAHIHVPEGATPKDGPSAGITMFTALASAFTKMQVKNKLAMTGEITLRGKVLPVGGIKEKILAAKRAGMIDIVLSIENEKDVKDIKPNYVKGLKFHYIQEMKEIRKIALVN